MNFEKLKNKILNIGKGSQFYKADLHIHTPASYDYEDKSVTPERIVEAAINKGLDIIAITDHNSVDMCDKVIKAARGKKLIVFPGVEITMSGGKNGIHLVAIFDFSTPIDHIKDCLSQIGLDSKMQQKGEKAITTKSFEDIAKKIVEYKGLLIAAHGWSGRGIMGDMKGQQRIKIVQNENLIAIEISKDEHNRLLNGTDPEYQRAIAGIKSSDAHSLDKIGDKFTLLKLGELNIEGIRQALRDFESRVRYSKEDIHKHPYIVGMYVDGGFLDGQVFHFNENMNSLIGGKGTGKTTAIELLRFVLNSRSKDAKLRRQHDKIVENVLEDGTVYVLLKSKDNKFYYIIRRNKEEPTIYKENDEKFNVDIKNFHEFFCLEAYSQGELISIAENSINQLEMIDEYTDLKKSKENEDSLIAKLSDNAKALNDNTSIIEEWKDKIKQLPVINEKIRIIEERGLKGYTEKQKKWAYEKNIIDTNLDFIKTKLKEFKEKNNKVFREFSLEEKSITNRELMAELEKIIKKVNDNYNDVNSRFICSLEEDFKHIEALKENWNKKEKKYSQNINETIKELKDKGVDIDFADYKNLEEEKVGLDNFDKKIQEKEKENEYLLENRKELLKNLKQIRGEIYYKRKEEIEKVNTKLDSIVKISLKNKNDYNIYQSWLEEVFKGSGLNKNSRENLCKEMEPDKLYSLINSNIDGLEKFLSNKVGISEKSANKILNWPKFKSSLYDLQTIKLEDSVEIKLKDNGWKPLEKLSTGGKCTAILLIAMLERAVPLLIDQPEDSLDNEFIYKAIVKTIRELKDKRQIIVVTHNANIPVLGDCELMYVLKSNGLNGKIVSSGVIDNKDIKQKAQIILEGSEQAFKKRKEKYGI